MHVAMHDLERLFCKRGYLTPRDLHSLEHGHLLHLSLSTVVRCTSSYIKHGVAIGASVSSHPRVRLSGTRSSGKGRVGVVP